MANSTAKRSRRRRQKMTTALTTVGTLQPQEHGGALRNGGTNRGGHGAVKLEWREKCRQALVDSKGMDVVLGIISGDIFERIGTDKQTGKPIYGETKNRDRLGAIE